MADVDITYQIKLIESLKCALLNDISSLFENMRVPGRENQNENLASLVTDAYLLAGRLGLGYESLDEQIIKRLKQKWASDAHNTDINALLMHWAARADVNKKGGPS